MNRWIRIRHRLSYLLLFLMLALILFIRSSVLPMYAFGSITQFPNQSHTQMMSYLIQTGYGRLVVIDGGTAADAKQLADQILQKGGIVSAWFISHPHFDHAQAIQTVATTPGIRIERIYGSMLSESDVQAYEPQRVSDVIAFNRFIAESGHRFIELKVGDRIDVDDLAFNVLGVRNLEITRNFINNSSCVIRMTSPHISILFLGDLGVEGGAKLMRDHAASLKSDIVQMAHHGQAGVDWPVYERIAPNVCLWPTPDWLLTIESEQDAFNSAPYDARATISWAEQLDAVSVFAFMGERTLPLIPVDQLRRRLAIRRSAK